jgi:hypothetical protein
VHEVKGLMQTKETEIPENRETPERIPKASDHSDTEQEMHLKRQRFRTHIF